MNETDKKKKFIIDFLYIAIIVGIGYLAFSKLYPVLSPLVIAWIVASLLHRSINFLSKKLKINQKIVAVIVMVVSYLVTILFIFLIATRIFGAIKDLFITFPAIYTNNVEPYIVTMFNEIKTDLAQIDPSFMAAVNDFANSLLAALASAVSNISMWVVSLITNFVTSLPNTFIRILVSIIASVFMAIDYQEIIDFVSRQFTQKTKDLTIDIKNYLINILWSYVRSYSLIMLITFTELAIGFTIFGINKGVLIALIIAVFDILPILGTGTVMIPWIVVTLIQQNFAFALQLGIIYIIVTIVRNVMEPKIVGSQVGLPPLVTLISVFVGAQLFGILGLFGLPVFLSLINYLNKKKTITLYK